MLRLARFSSFCLEISARVSASISEDMECAALALLVLDLAALAAKASGSKSAGSCFPPCGDSSARSRKVKSDSN